MEENKPGKLLVTSLLENKTDPDFIQLVINILEKFKILGHKMSLKVHFPHSHLVYCPENLGAFSEEDYKISPRYIGNRKAISRKVEHLHDSGLLLDSEKG